MKVPVPAQVILAISIPTGAWNGFIGVITTLNPAFRETHNDEPGMICLFYVLAFGGILLLGSSILALMGKEIGRKLFLVCLVLGGLFFLASYFWMFNEFEIIGFIFGTGGPLAVIFFIFRYFISDSVKEKYVEQDHRTNRLDGGGS